MLNRFEWQKAVLQDGDLGTTAKTLASALAAQFTNDETGQTNPSTATLARYICVSTDTVKRAIKALVAGGWLGRSEGRGRGNKTQYILCSPGKIIPFSASQKGGNPAPLEKEKGANLHGKGGKSAPFHYKDKQSLNKRGREGPACPLTAYRVVHDQDTSAIGQWNDWLSKHSFPSLQQVGIRCSDQDGAGYQMPTRWPPSDQDEAGNRNAVRYLHWIMDQGEVRYAAQ